jgi:hypothetical protein
MAELILLDVAPDPVGSGALLAVVFLVMGFIVLLGIGLVLFLWYRKRSMRSVVMAPHEPLSVAGADHVPSNPNQP